MFLSGILCSNFLPAAIMSHIQVSTAQQWLALKNVSRQTSFRDEEKKTIKNFKKIIGMEAKLSPLKNLLQL